MAPAQPALAEPTQFILAGYDIEITYETTSFVGTPRFSIVRHGQNLDFSGEEIQVEITQLGKMVTVNLSANQSFVQESLVAADTFETLTLLVPTISVPVTTLTAPMQTIAIFSRRSPQARVAGQSQSYMTVSLSGVANKIDF